jgi:hypothetical protein
MQWKKSKFRYPQESSRSAGVIFNNPKDRNRPILLKNSLFEDDGKLLAHLTDLLFFDTRGYGSRSKVRCEATGAAR